MDQLGALGLRALPNEGGVVRRKAGLVAGCLVALSMSAAGNATEWVQTWGAAPQPPAPAQGPFPATPTFANQTIRQAFRVSVGGSRLRLRLTNEYGTRPLAVGAVRVALADEKGDIQAGTERAVLFAGKPRGSRAKARS